MPITLAPRRTQADRSASTRRRLLEATVACLVERGYSGATTAAVAERAGVSRGAQLHHYGTRQRLMGAAVEHLAAQRLEAVQSAAAGLPEDDTRPRRALDLLLGRGVGSLLSPVRPGRQRQALDAWARLLTSGGAR